MTLRRGWCPGAWRPMAAADGLLVRVRPPLGRMTGCQTARLAEAAQRWGNGQLDLTRRGAIQIRGVVEASHRNLIGSLVEAGLVSPKPDADDLPSILVAPDWCPGDDVYRMATDLAGRLGELPPLPAKTGFTIGLADGVGDFRIEHARDGGLLLRADGRPTGVALVEGREVEAALALARWFATSGGAVAGRMARHLAPLPDALAGDVLPAAPPARPRQGPHPLGFVVGLPFGRIAADRLADMAATADAVRVTPWRMLIVEGDRVPPPVPVPAPLLVADACVGAPECPQATVATRDLAGRLAGTVAGSLHVSGCAKGCARSGPASVVLTGRDGCFDLGFDGRAGDRPAQRGLSPDRVLAALGID